MTDLNFWKRKKVFITGATGFKGSWLSIWLHSLGADVTSISLPPPTLPSLFELAKVNEISSWIEGDIRDLSSLSASIKKTKPDIVFHLAAQPLVSEGYVDPVGTYSTNVMGSVNLLEAIRGIDTVRAVVMVTTDKCYENKEWYWGYREDEAMGGYDPYSSSKGCSELVTSAYRRSFFNPLEYGISHQTAIASARAGNVIGGGDYALNRLVPDIVRAVLSNETVLIRNPGSTRPWQHVLEPLSGYLILAQKLYEEGTDFAEPWNFGPSDDDAKPVEWIVKELCNLWPGNSGYRVEKKGNFHEANYLKLDSSKARGRLGWYPKWTLTRALGRIVEWHTGDLLPRDAVLRDISLYTE